MKSPSPRTAKPPPRKPPGRSAPAAIDTYIAGFPDGIAARLAKVRATIAKAVPDAEQGISYRIAALKLDGRPLLYFAAFKGHIGLYPMTAGVKAALEAGMAPYPQSKGTLRFPHDGKLPLTLIGKIAKLRAKEIRASRAGAQTGKRP